MLLLALLHNLQERVPLDRHAVQLWLPRLPVQALCLHQAEGGLLQLVQRVGAPRQDHHQRYRPVSASARCGLHGQ